MKSLKTSINAGLATIAVMAPSLTFAAGTSGTIDQPEVVVDETVIKNALAQITTWVLSIGFTLAVLVLVYGGVMYMLSAGDSTKMNKAKAIIMYALIGVFIMAAAWVLVSLIGNFLISSVS